MENREPNEAKTNLEEEKAEQGQEKEPEMEPQKMLPFAPNTPREKPSTLKVFLMTLAVIGIMLLIGWVRSKIGR